MKKKLTILNDKHIDKLRPWALCVLILPLMGCANTCEKKHAIKEDLQRSNNESITLKNNIITIGGLKNAKDLVIGVTQENDEDPLFLANDEGSLVLVYPDITILKTENGYVKIKLNDGRKFSIITGYRPSERDDLRRINFLEDSPPKYPY